MFKTARIFLLYWALILPLGGYLTYDYCTDYSAELEPVLRNTVQDGIQAGTKINDEKLLWIQRYVDAYIIPRFKEIGRKAKAARAQVTACQGILGRSQSQYGRIDKAQISEIRAALNRLGDSLLVFSDRDSLLAIDLQALIFQQAAVLQTPQATAFFRNAHPAQVDLFLADLTWKLELALNGLLAYFSDYIHQADIKFDSANLMLSPINCARAGQPFSAEIFLAGYSIFADNLQCQIDGRAYPVRHGLIEFDTVYNQPGEHQQQVDIRVWNPLTERWSHYSKEFFINIRKP